MRKESQHYQQSQNIYQHDKQQCQDNRKTIKKLAEIKSKTDFIQLLKSLPIEIRYLAVKVEAPGLPHSIRNTLKKLQNKNQILETRKHLSKVSKAISEALVFVSDGRQYFDSICFEFNYIQHPQKLYDLLMNPQQNTKKFNPIQQMNKNRKPIPDCIVQVNLCKTKQDLFATVINILRHQIFYSCCKKGYIQLNDQKNRKKQLSFYWKNLSQEYKKKILLLNKGDFKQLSSHLLSLNINIKLDDLEKEFNNLLSLQKNQFCNRILKCKLKRSLIGLTDYHEQVYSAWKRDLDKTKKKRNRKNNHMKQQHEKIIKQCRHNCKNQNKIIIESSQKINVKYLQKQNYKRVRQKSHSVDSFQTNQTQIQWQLKFKHQNNLKSQQKKIEVQRLIEEQIAKNIIQCSDFISAEANLFYQRRLVAYNRIQYVMGLYGIPIKLFGSCANGIAIKNSDIDIALDNCITNYFNLCEQSQRPKFALQFMAGKFSQYKWIQNLKLLKNATIPILKLTVNTQIAIQPVATNYQMNEKSLEYLNSLNRNHNKGYIQVDITIETQSKTFECNHLGIKTTQQINQWLQAFKPLRYLTLILKNYLMIQNLNVTYQGGINTYVTIVMLVAAIYKLKLQNQENVNTFTETILKFYAFQFDETKFGIDIRDIQNPFYLKKIQQLNFKQIQYSKAELQVLDPLNNGKVMTKKCYKFSKIKQIFELIYVQCFSKYRKQQEQFFSIKNVLQKRNSESQKNEKKQISSNSSQLLQNSKQMMYDNSQSSDIQTTSEKEKNHRNPFLWILKQKCLQMVFKQY